MNKQELYSDIKILLDKFCNEYKAQQNISNAATGEKYTFLQLLKKYEGIKIPIIQRDYAQGREDTIATNIRQEFLSNIKEAIINDSELNLDFVYGNVNTKNFFEPLDGQQRLTTLFLLYLYAYKKDYQDCNLLKKFSYETRVSTREFFEELTEQNFKFEKDISLKQTIENLLFFHPQWISDPTVSACLNTLEDIHKKFCDIENLYKKLNNISFYLLDIENFNLSDDLYIKMNSRGKALTCYENLKAQILKWMKMTNYPDTEQFSKNIDTDWSKFLWNIEKSSKNADISIKKIDDFHIFIIIAAVLKTFVETNKEVDDYKQTDYAKVLNKITNAYNSTDKNKYLDRAIFDIFKNKSFFGTFKDVFENENIKFEEKTLLQNFARNTVENIKNIYELSTKYENKIKEILENNKINYEFKNNNDSLKSIFELILKENNSYSDYILFFAQIFYLETKEKDNISEKDFAGWIKFVRNLTALDYITLSTAKLKSDKYIRDQRFTEPFNLIKKISDYKNSSEPFSEFMQNLSSDIENKAKDSKEEKEEKHKIQQFKIHEKQKSDFIHENPDLESVICELENNILLKGNLKFIFEYFISNNRPAIDLQKLSNALKKCFDETNNITNEFRRAILSVNENAYDFEKNRHNCYTLPVSKNPQNHDVKKYRLFENFSDIQWCLNEGSPEVKNNFKTFFELLIKYSDEENPCLKIIQEYKDKAEDKTSWIYRLISNEQYLDNHTHYIVVCGGNAYCLKKERPAKEEDFLAI